MDKTFFVMAAVSLAMEAMCMTCRQSCHQFRPIVLGNIVIILLQLGVVKLVSEVGVLL
jgi:phage-related minor tail protein